MLMVTTTEGMLNGLHREGEKQRMSVRKIHLLLQMLPALLFPNVMNTLPCFQDAETQALQEKFSIL